MNGETTLVFVYGSLMRGLHNHRLLAEGHARFVREDETCGFAWAMADLGSFPGVLAPGAAGLDADEAADLRPIRGEVWEVDAATLARLDRLEGHPHFYRRQPVMLAGRRAVEGRVEFYVYQARGVREGRDLALVASGDWRAYYAAVKAQGATR